MIKQYAQIQKPVEAVQYDGTNEKEIMDFCNVVYWEPQETCSVFVIKQGRWGIGIVKGDWVVKTNRSFSVKSAEEFNRKYYELDNVFFY